MRIAFLILTIISFLCKEGIAQYTINGNASRDNCHCYTLTPNSPTMKGSVWNNNRIDLAQSFDFTFQVFLGCTDANGADGIAFVLQPISTSVGGTGAGMGYGGISPGVAVTLDTYQNSSPDNDPFYDHIAIQLNGDVNHSSANTITPITRVSSTNDNVEDCQNHLLRIVWNATTKNMGVFFDGVARVNATRDFVATVFGGNSLVYWGFTGATGALYNTQKFCTTLTPYFHFSPTQKKCVNEPITFIDSTSSFSNALKRYWNFGDGSPIDSVNVNPVHIYSSPGTYNVVYKVVSPDGCEELFPQTVIIGNSPIVDFSITDSCSSNTINFIDHSSVANTDTLFSWYWDFDNSSITSTLQNSSTAYVTGGIKNIKFVVTTKMGCRSDTLRRPINIHERPVNNFDFTDSVCIGSPTIFHDQSTVSVGSVNYWQWTYSDSSFPATIKNPTHVFLNPGPHQVTLVTSSTGLSSCMATPITKTVYVADKPRIEMHFSDTCKFLPVHFTANETSTSIGIDEWHWNFGDNTLDEGTPITHIYTNNGQYVVSLYAISSEGCPSDVITDPINVFGTDAFAGLDTIIAPNQPLYLQAVGGINYQWWPSYGLSATNISNPVAMVASDISYYLKASTLEGCESFDTINIKIYKGPDIYIPSAFTPNHDGLNDILKPFNVGLKRFDYFKIFNRYGDVVFSTNSNREGWNGKLNAKDQPTGTYVWIVSGLDYSGKTITKKGTVILLR